MFDNLLVRLVGKEKVQNVLEIQDIPHYDICDMSLIYFLNGNLVTTRFMEEVSMSLQELNKIAMDGIHCKIIRMSDLLNELFGGSFCAKETPEMYVASTENMQFGASVIAHPEFMQKAASIVGGDFYILPSSIHEVILLKDDGIAKVEELLEIVKTINETEVSEKDRLTDSVYHYDCKRNVFELADEYEKKEKRSMNKAKRKKLEQVFDKLCEAQDILQEVKEEEEESYDNLPESLQYSDKGDEMQNYIEMMEEADSYLDDAKSVIEQI